MFSVTPSKASLRRRIEGSVAVLVRAPAVAACTVKNVVLSKGHKLVNPDIKILEAKKVVDDVVPERLDTQEDIDLYLFGQPLLFLPRPQKDPNMPPRAPIVSSPKYVFGDTYHRPIEDEGHASPEEEEEEEEEECGSPPKEEEECGSSRTSDPVQAFYNQKRCTVKKSIRAYTRFVRRNISHEGPIDDLEIFSMAVCKAALSPAMARFILTEQSINDKWRQSKACNGLKRRRTAAMVRSEKHKIPRSSLLKNEESLTNFVTAEAVRALIEQVIQLQKENGFKLKNVTAQKPVVIESVTHYHHSQAVQIVEVESIDNEAGVEITDTPVLLVAGLGYNPFTRTVSRINAEPAFTTPPERVTGVPLERTRTIFVDSVRPDLSTRLRLRAFSCAGSSQNTMFS